MTKDLSFLLLFSCSAISKISAPEEKPPVVKEAIETSTKGVPIKVDEKGDGQNELLDAVYLSIYRLQVTRPIFQRVFDLFNIC